MYLSQGCRAFSKANLRQLEVQRLPLIHQTSNLGPESPPYETVCSLRSLSQPFSLLNAARREPSRTQPPFALVYVRGAPRRGRLSTTRRVRISQATAVKAKKSGHRFGIDHQRTGEISANSAALPLSTP